MNYPIWYLPNIGGGLFIAIIAVFHALLAHFAVGGGLFLVLTEWKGVKSKNADLISYVKSHTYFFLVLTMVFGGVSGVGIWFIISLVSPSATSSLIHNFVFGWAIEWVFFICEIIALLIYHYRFGKMDARKHLIVGWLYFIFAWLSLFIINGILSFMLTPGKWLETGNFWHGFFNPGFIPSLIFRTSIAVIIAGVFGMITAAFRKDAKLRIILLRYCARWMYAPVVLLLLSGIFYTWTLSNDSFINLFYSNPQGKIFITILVISSALLFAFGLFTIFKLDNRWQKIFAFVLVFICLSWMSGFEYMREIARKPYILYGFMFSNGIKKNEIKSYNKTGFLNAAKWSAIKTVSEENMLEAGEELLRLQCLACHTTGGYNSIKNRTKKYTERGIEAMLTGMGKIKTYMPPFAGDEKEKQSLAAYIYRVIHGKIPSATSFTPAKLKTEIPSFSSQKDNYVLLVWNDLGMHCISDDEKYFSFLPPANTLNAQLFRRGPKPQLITVGVDLQYEAEPAHAHPEKHSLFWKYAKSIFGAEFREGYGLSGKEVNGRMDIKGDHFTAEYIPVVPYRDDGIYSPYPVFTVQAIDKKTGNVLITTKAVAPNSTEMGCRNCHGGGFGWKGISGVSDETSINILSAHDAAEGTSLLKEAEKGNPRLCQSCHADPALGAPGKKGILNFSSAMHGFHANYLSDMSYEACNMCHPSRPEGNTKCLRDRHAKTGINCTNCHGKIEDHALSLLTGQQEIKKAGVLMAGLTPFYVKDKGSIKARTPWLMEPDCKGCHTDFSIKKDFSGTSYNQWVPGFDALYRNRTDTQGVMCAACHSSTHAVYGSENIYEKHRDNIQPLQYQKLAGTIGTRNNCAVCHTVTMNMNGHHRNMVNRKKPAAIVLYP